MTLATTMAIKSTVQDGREVPVIELGATDVPDHKGGGYARRIGPGNEFSWDGHTRDEVPRYLTTWTFPDRVRDVRDRAERILEEAIPDQRRRFLRNQEHGMFDDRWITDVALGEDVERPFTRWTKNRRGEVRVAVCLDGSVCVGDRKTMLEARMCVAAGIASALEALGYEVSVLSATLTSRLGDSKPRVAHDPFVFATVIKEESEPFVESGFAHLADTGLRRLVSCWVAKSDGWDTHLCDSEWRALTGADLFVFIGPADSKPGGLKVINEHGLPEGESIGPVGDDVIRLNVNGPRDVDGAVERLEKFFVDQFGE